MISFKNCRRYFWSQHTKIHPKISCCYNIDF